MVYPHSYRTEHSETRTSNSVYGEYHALYHSKRIPIQPNLLKIIQCIDSHRGKFLSDLATVVQIKSVSGELEYRDDLLKMSDFTQERLSELGIKYERFNIGFQELGGQNVRLPTVILASLGTDPSKKTLCVYIHLDVKKPEESRWETDPWKLAQKGNYIYGCGVAQGKANLMQWLQVIWSFQKTKVEFPVNLKFIIESMYHFGSVGLSEFLALRKQDFFVNTDDIVVCDSEWIGEKHPCIIYGTVGVIHFDIYAERLPGSKTDPHQDLVNIFTEVVDEEEQILIPNFEDTVTQVTPEEEKMYEGIGDFNVDDVRESLPPFKQKWDKVKLLMSYWRLPSIWVGETEECTCDKKAPEVVKRHFIVKIVPRQIIDGTTNQVLSHINSVVKNLKIENKITCRSTFSTRYWHENAASHNYQAARRATIQIYKEDPSLIREDKARVNITILDRVLEHSIVLLPMVSHGSNAGGDNENITVRNFYEGTKLLAAYLFQLAM